MAAGGGGGGEAADMNTRLRFCHDSANYFHRNSSAETGQSIQRGQISHEAPSCREDSELRYRHLWDLEVAGNKAYERPLLTNPRLTSTSRCFADETVYTA